MGAGKLSDALEIVKDQASPIWAPSGIMAAFVLLYGYHLWTAVFLGTVTLNLWSFHHYSGKAYVPSCLVSAIFSTIEVVSVAWFLNHPPEVKRGRMVFAVKVLSTLS